MAKKPAKKKPAKDYQQIARRVLNSVAPDAKPPAKNPAAVALGRLGGLKGGKARASKLTKKQRSEIAKKAARARWNSLPN
jgi:hypothetical protein